MTDQPLFNSTASIDDGRVLILGSQGKLSLALQRTLADGPTLRVCGSMDFDANIPETALPLIADFQPDTVINAVAQAGIAQAIDDPERAYRLNAEFPKFLARLSVKHGFVLVHFSSNSVFGRPRATPFGERDAPTPMHVYGFSKHLGDTHVAALAARHYLVRVPILFGPARRADQFVEKMLHRIATGERKLRIATDVVSSPSFSNDVAEKIVRIIAQRMPYGLYHVTNQGEASLFDLMGAIVARAFPEVEVEPAEHAEFPHRGGVDLYAPLVSEKLPPMRHWREAVNDYTSNLDMAFARGN